jgi:hypothetical protein
MVALVVTSIYLSVTEHAPKTAKVVRERPSLSVISTTVSPDYATALLKKAFNAKGTEEADDALLKKADALNFNLETLAQNRQN